MKKLAEMGTWLVDEGDNKGGFGVYGGLGGFGFGKGVYVEWCTWTVDENGEDGNQQKGVRGRVRGWKR